MNAARIDEGSGERGDLAELVFDAQSGLHVD